MNIAGKFLGILGGCMIFSLALMQLAHASFQLESMGVVLEENIGRVNFSIKNTSSEPILLATKLADLDDKEFSKSVLISPPIARIDAGQSQQVHFVLKQGTTLTHEVMLKASFEGIGQAVDNSARMPVRQSVGLIIQPRAVAVSKAPWEDLHLTIKEGYLVIKNEGPHVVRLAPQLVLLPSKINASLDNYFLMAGEEVKVGVKGKPTAVAIVPLSRYGFKQDEVTLPVK